MNRLLIVIVTGVVLLAACGKEQQPANTPSAPIAQKRSSERANPNVLEIEREMLRDLRITTTKVELRPASEGVELLGEVQVNESSFAQIGAPIASRVIEIHAAPGQSVQKGAPLATVQSVELGKARSDYISAQAKLQLAQRTFERKRRLNSERIVAQREVQEAEANEASAEADLRAAKAALGALGARDDASDSSELILRSPVTGTVIERTALRGQMADPAQPLFKVADLTHLWLAVHAFERDVVQIHPGVTARVTFPALPGRTFPAKVTLVGKEVDPTSRTVAVRVEVTNKEGLLRPGMSATAWVPLGNPSQKVITVPATALQRLQEEWVVFIPLANDKYEIRKIGRGRDLGGETEVLKGLRPGEEIVVDGAFLLKAQAEKARSEGEEHAHD
jgi:cobalt-zinc-cadmium efflux system membrane fusion protein